MDDLLDGTAVRESPSFVLKWAVRVARALGRGLWLPGQPKARKRRLAHVSRPVVHRGGPGGDLGRSGAREASDQSLERATKERRGGNV